MNLTYEDFCDPHEVQVYKRVKRRAMRLADVARVVAAEMVGGQIGDGGRSEKEFVRTPKGLYRMSFSTNSDNTTEVAAHRRMGAKRVVMGDSKQMRYFFDQHSLSDGAYEEWLVRVRTEL